MKNGIICKEDGDALLEIYRAINVWDGSLNRNLTMDEMVFIFAIGHAIKENFGEESEAYGNSGRAEDLYQKSDKATMGRMPTLQVCA